MKWKKKRNAERWESDAGYEIECRPGSLCAYSVYKPPGETFRSLGGTSSLYDAKRMARQHEGLTRQCQQLSSIMADALK